MKIEDWPSAKSMPALYRELQELEVDPAALNQRSEQSIIDQSFVE